MFVRLGKILVVITLVTMLGAHWALLQTVAWTTMLADNLRTHTLSESVARTFDGDHPCPICKAIAAAKNSEHKSEAVSPALKLEFPPANENFALVAPAQFQLLPLENFSAKSFTLKPPLPPPRGFSV